MQNRNSLFCLFLITENHWPGIVKRQRISVLHIYSIIINREIWNREPGKYAEQRFSVLTISYTREPGIAKQRISVLHILRNHKQRNLKREFLACNLKNSQNRDFKLCSSPFRNTSLRNNNTIKRATTENFIHSPENLCFAVFYQKNLCNQVTELPTFCHRVMLSDCSVLLCLCVCVCPA